MPLFIRKFKVIRFLVASALIRLKTSFFFFFFFQLKQTLHPRHRQEEGKGRRPMLTLYFQIGPGVLACATRGGGRSEAGHCFHLLFSFSFFLFFFFFFFFSAFYFSPTSGNLPCVKICFPQYFGITRRYMQKKIFFLGNFYFFKTNR